MIREILAKESLDENDIAILVKNIHLLSHEDLVRLGFETETVEEDVKILETVEEAPKKRGKKV